jgi:hypothetical protein
MGEQEDSQWKYNRAAEAHAHRLEDKPDSAYLPQQRGNVPMYHIGFYYYIRWILGALPPLQDVSKYWTEEEGESYHDHVRYYGRPKETYEVVSFLIELLDRTFYQVFGCRADLEDYMYVAEIIARASSKLEIIPFPMSTANSWLNEQIERMQSARLKENRLAEQAALIAEAACSHSSYEILTTTHVFVADYVVAEQVGIEPIEAEQVEIEPIETESIEIEQEAEPIEVEQVDAGLEAEQAEVELIETEQVEAELIEAEQVDTEQVAAELTHLSDPWEGVFRNYTLAKLNNLLVFVGLLDTVNPITIAEYTRPGQWAAIISALIKAKRVTNNRTTVGKAFCKTYGDETVSTSTYKRPHQKSFNELYNNALSRITED